jgi:uncharacterized OsmC-like protein
MRLKANELKFIIKIVSNYCSVAAVVVDEDLVMNVAVVGLY